MRRRSYPTPARRPREVGLSNWIKFEVIGRRKKKKKRFSQDTEQLIQAKSLSKKASSSSRHQRLTSSPTAKLIDCRCRRRNATRRAHRLLASASRIRQSFASSAKHQLKSPCRDAGVATASDAAEPWNSAPMGPQNTASRLKPRRSLMGRSHARRRNRRPQSLPSTGGRMPSALRSASSPLTGVVRLKSEFWREPPSIALR